MKNRDAYFELLVYLVSSASRITGEPAVYAPLRLIEAAERVCKIMLAEGDSNPQDMEDLIEIIERGKHKNMTDSESFYKMLEEASEKLVDCM